jgi:uncharacterized protein YbjT (DUF2867 family)
MTQKNRTVLILGGSGRTGSLIERRLSDRGLRTRTASRHGSEVRFDWDDPSTYAGALEGVDRIYLVTPTARVRYVDPVAKFLDLAESVDVAHVTLLSTYNGDRAPSTVDVAAVEREVASRKRLSHTILRPSWVMQNFTDHHLPLTGGAFIVPSNGGSEAFVDAVDIAEVAVETLVNPDEHAGAAYALTGPEAITFYDVARVISSVSGQSVIYQDIDQETWINGAVAAGLPKEYAEMLRWLTDAIITGNGSRPTNDVEKVIGRPATRFEEFAYPNAALWTAKENA